MLWFIGIGPTEKDISLRAIEVIKKCSKVYLESYTNFLGINKEKIERIIGKNVFEIERKDLEENSEKIIEEAKEENIAIITLGNPLVATTHYYFLIEGIKKGVKVTFLHCPSILDLVLETGLHVYKFGKIASIAFHYSETPYEILRQNLSINAHTLFLLDLDPKNKKFMTIREGLLRLLKIEEKRREKIISEDTMVVACSRLGREDRKIVYGKIREILEIDFGNPPYCFIVPAELHFTEEEALELWKIS